jgi:hypothetical protein
MGVPSSPKSGGRVLSSPPVDTPLLVELLTCLTRSIPLGYVPLSYNSEYFTPLLNKSDLDESDVMSYRQVSNLSVASKCL